MRTILLVAALGLTGCADPKPLPMAATPESSRAALVAAFDGWKAGKTHREMAAQSSPLILIDDDLNRGAKLLDYTIEGEGKPLGTGYTYLVNLTLQDGAKTPAKKKIAYRAVTEPQLAVSREDRQP